MTEKTLGSLTFRSSDAGRTITVDFDGGGEYELELDRFICDCGGRKTLLSGIERHDRGNEYDLCTIWLRCRTCRDENRVILA